MLEHLTFHTVRANWQWVNTSIHELVRCYDTARVEFSDSHPVDKTQVLAADTVLVSTRNVERDVALIICKRIPDSLSVQLFTDQLPDAQQPIAVDRLPRSPLDPEEQMDSADDLAHSTTP